MYTFDFQTHSIYNVRMSTVQTFLQVVWASVVALGWIKVILAVFVISFLSRIQSVLGLLAALLFIAYLAHWI
jgi:hypothetical protein